jgi:8-oxo-dGTP pyrophosphatase MutT (NUDIX family)
LSRPELRAAAVAICVVERSDEEPAFLLTRRAPRMRAHAGQWALPGGSLDEDESPAVAALRELDEEVGLSLDASSVLGMLDDYATRSGFLITPVVVWAGRLEEELEPHAPEVAELYVVPLSMIDVEPRFHSIPESDAPVIQLPMYGRFVHAPTAAVIYQFRELALHGRTTRVAHYEQPVFAWK